MNPANPLTSNKLDLAETLDMILQCFVTNPAFNPKVSTNEILVFNVMYSGFLQHMSIFFEIGAMAAILKPRIFAETFGAESQDAIKPRKYFQV